MLPAECETMKIGIGLAMFATVHSDSSFFWCTSLPSLQGTERPYYDVVIVGSGPAGACLGYYLVKKGRKVLTLEKKSFPRDKICGDALCKTGIEILMEMGLYEKLLKEDKAHIVSSCVK